MKKYIENETSKKENTKTKTGIIVAITILAISLIFAMFLLFQFGPIGQKVVVTEYSVATIYNTKECEYGIYDPNTGDFECRQWGISNEVEKIPGFYKELPEDAVHTRYEVTFKVGNKAGKHLDVIGVKVIFCDANNNELYSELTSVYDIPNSYAKESSITLYESHTSYFYNIEKVRFETIIE